MKRYAIELVTGDDVKAFTNAVKTVDADVRLVGRDENGNPWELSAKSLLCSLLLPANIQTHREHNAHEVDWNTIWCICEEDIYSKIQQFVK